MVFKPPIANPTSYSHAAKGHDTDPWPDDSQKDTGRNPISPTPSTEGGSGEGVIRTVNFLGSSYSGCDIQIVMHCGASEMQRREIQEKLEWNETRRGGIELSLQDHMPGSEDWRSLQEMAHGSVAERNRLIEEQKSIPPSGVVLGTAQTLSVQSFRATKPVRALGHVSPKGVAKGGRTIGGSIVFTVLDEHALASFMNQPPSSYAGGRGGAPGFQAYSDQLPPMTITVLFANEYGSMSELNIYGVEFVTDGQVMSIEDIFSETTCSFLAKDYDVMLRRGRVKLSGVPLSQVGRFDATSASSLLKNEEYLDLKKRLGVMRDPYR